MAKTSMSEERAKKLCYERRASSIIKKTKELQILCDVNVGVVILGPDGKLERCWPPRLSDVKSLFDACKENPKVKREKRKLSPDDENSSPLNCGREILVSKLQLLKQREEELLFKSTGNQGKEEIAATNSEVRSEGYREILNSKLNLLNKRETVFNSNHIIDSSMETTIESLLCDDGVVTQNDLGPFSNDDLDDDFFNFEFDNGCYAATENDKEIGRMESGILQCSAAYYDYECGENGEVITSMYNNGMGNQGGLWYDDGDNSVNHTLCQNSFTDFYNTSAIEECGVRKKARLLRNSLNDEQLPPQHWESVFTHALQNYTEEAEEFLKLQF